MIIDRYSLSLWLWWKRFLTPCQAGVSSPCPQMTTPASHHPGLPKVYTIKILNIEIESNRPRESRSCRYLTWCKPPSVKNLRGQTGTSVSGQTL